jgi:hypothetical protein
MPVRHCVLRALPVLMAALGLAPRAGFAQGDPLGPEFRVNTYTSAAQRYPSIASSPAGDFVVVWQSFTQDGSGRGVFAQRYSSSGVPLGAEFLVNTYLPGDQDRPAVASDGVGNFVVAWSSANQDGSSDGIFAQRYSSMGSPLGPEFRVNSATLGKQDLPDVASDPSGNFVVVWLGDVQVFGQRYASSGSPLGPEFRVNTSTSAFQLMHPSVAMDALGGFVVAWASKASGYGWHISGQRYASTGSPLGTEFRVNTAPIPVYFPQGSGAASAGPLGEFTVVWAANSSASGWDVSGQRFASSGVPLGAEFRVNSYTTGPENFPSIATDGLGNFVVVWTSYGQQGVYGVFGQRYESSGIPAGPEFRVSTYVTSFKQHPEVAAAPDGSSFVVVWISEDQDGSYGGIFGQRFGPIVPVELTQFRID